MALRDLVNSEGCDPDATRKNGLTRMVDHMYRDKSQREFSEYRQTPQQQRPMRSLNNKYEQRLNSQSSGMEQAVENFLEGGFGTTGPVRFDEELDLNSFEEQNVREFMDFRQQQRGGGFDLSHGVPPEMLKDYIQSWMNSARTDQNFRPMHLPDHQFSEIDKAKIGKRSQNLTRHIFATYSQQMIDQELTRFLDSFHIGNEVLPRERVDEMAEEFVNTFGREGPSLAHHDLEHAWQENERDRMVNEFERFSMHDEMERQWRQQHESNRWLDEFEGRRPIERVHDARQAAHNISQINDPKLQKSNFMRFINDVKTGNVDVTSGNNELVVTNQGKTEVNKWAEEFDTKHNPSGRWAEEFDVQHNPERWVDDFQQQQQKQNQEENWDVEFEQMMRRWNGLDSGAMMNSFDYVFTPLSENPYRDHPNPMAKGKELFDEGQLSQAVLALEVELQRNGQNSHCWHLLGQAHAENDQDSKAIEALSKAVETDAKNGDARMALAVSFTNDLYKENALGCLMEWINNNDQFRSFYIPFDVKNGNFSDYHAHVTDIYLAAARQNPKNPDPDVQTGLGLLFNLSVEYEKAADCFRAALASRPNDYLLWNKLGATLANSSTAPKDFQDPAQAKDYSIRCSREALGCYFNALKVKPSYVRARSNLAISYMLLEDYPNAVRQFLTALTMHPEATHMWINLESTLIKYGRNDLIGLAEKHDVELFRGVIDW